MNKKTSVIVAVVLICLFSPLGWAETPLVVHASSPINTTQYSMLEEVFVAEDSPDYTPSQDEDTVRWVWWSWSESTGSDWPDDDALYRAEQLGLNVSTVDEPLVFSHPVDSEKHVSLTGDVEIMAGEIGYWFVQFHLEITPLVNLSNDTLLYIVLTEDVSEDHHGRQGVDIVHELRPEVGFSLEANNVTETTFSLSSDHLAAAGVDLRQISTGWRYSLVIFNETDDTDAPMRILSLTSGPLPSPYQHTTAGGQWAPIILMAVAFVICSAVVANSRKREEGIPRIKAVWSTTSPTTLMVKLEAGTLAFRTQDWTVEAPWKFKGRPPKPSLQPTEEKEFSIQFSQHHQEDCRFEVGLEVDEMGSWRQHVWLPPSSVTIEGKGSLEDSSTVALD